MKSAIGNPRSASQYDWFVPLVNLLVLCAVVQAIDLRVNGAWHFLSPTNLRDVALRSVPIALVAIGETLVILAGGIDLSVGSILGLTNVATAMLLAARVNPWLAALTGLAVGLACGLGNGLLVAYGRLAPFIVTLGMMGIARGMALVLTNAQDIYGVPDAFKWLSDGYLWRVPVGALVLLAVVVVAQMALSFTRFGRHLYAIGGNSEAARLSGVPVNRTLTAAFALCGLGAGLGGVMFTSFLAIGQPTAGKEFELDAIAAAVVGGASLMGGRGSVVGTLLGTAIIAVLHNGVNLLGYSVNHQYIVIGAVLVLAAAYDRFVRRRRMR